MGMEWVWNGDGFIFRIFRANMRKNKSVPIYANSLTAIAVHREVRG